MKSTSNILSKKKNRLHKKCTITFNPQNKSSLKSTPSNINSAPFKTIMCSYHVEHQKEALTSISHTTQRKNEEEKKMQQNCIWNDFLRAGIYLESNSFRNTVSREKSKTLRASASANSDIFACRKVLFILSKSLASHCISMVMVVVTWLQVDIQL